MKASRAREGKQITRISRSIARKVLEERVSLLLPNVLDDVSLRTQDSVLAAGIRSALCAPLWFTSSEGGQDEVIGLVYLDTSDRSHAFREEDLRILTALSNVAAAKIENVRLLEESLENYDGTIMIVSHDRALLRNLVTRIWSLDRQRIEDLEGSFDDWEAFKVSREKQARAAAAEAKQAEAKKPKEKLKPNEEHRARQAEERGQSRQREKAEQRVQALEGEIKGLEAKLADPDLYAKDPAQFDRLMKAIEKARDEKDEAEMRWLDLAEQVEALAG